MFRRSLTLALAAALLFAAGCARSQSQVSAAEASAVPTAPRKVLNFGNGAEPQDLDPQTITGTPEYRLMNAFFEGLVSQNPDGLHVDPGVAERWEISPEGLVYTFHLRADARWSTGAASARK